MRSEFGYQRFSYNRERLHPYIIPIKITSIVRRAEFRKKKCYYTIELYADLVAPIREREIFKLQKSGMDVRVTEKSNESLSFFTLTTTHKIWKRDAIQLAHEEYMLFMYSVTGEK